VVLREDGFQLAARLQIRERAVQRVAQLVLASPTAIT